MKMWKKFGLILVLALVSFGAQMGAAQAQSPIHGTFEFKLGPYLPAVDDEFGSGGPYEEFFDNSSMLLGELEVDYHLWQAFGKLSLGGHIGYGRVRGRMLLDDGEDVDSGDRATFRITPLRASLIYRYDYSALNHGIPLVPVVKAGLDYYLWRVSDPDGETATADGVAAIGGKAGWHVSAGLHLHLNFIDRRSAAAFDLTWGINNSYLFAEYTLSRVNNFGGSGLDLSANHWSLGLAFEF